MISRDVLTETFGTVLAGTSVDMASGHITAALTWPFVRRLLGSGRGGERWRAVGAAGGRGRRARPAARALRMPVR